MLWAALYLHEYVGILADKKSISRHQGRRKKEEEEKSFNMQAESTPKAYKQERDL